MKNLLILFSISLFFFACTGGTTSTAEGDSQDTTQTEETEMAMKYTLTPFTESASFPNAEIKSMNYQSGKFNFGIGGETYKLGVQTPDAPQKMCANSAKGQHIHLIVDDQPYAAKYVAKFDYEIADGEHHILAFLSRSYHESIKTKKASTVQKVMVKDNGFESTEAVEGPMLFYSRPKGEYIGKANTEKVMLDFFLHNVALGDKYMVKAEINGEEHIINKWQPYYIEGLPVGDNTIKLTLVDKEGKAVDIPLNPVSRTFKLTPDPAENVER